MDDVRFGMTVRSVRIRRGFRQEDLVALTHVSRGQIGRIEHGHLDAVPLGTLRKVCSELEIRIDLVPRWRGGDLDRMLSSRHALLAESVIAALRRDSPDWQVVPEVSFSIWGERGVVDLLAWHPGRRVLLVIELKTELVDIGETLGTMDRKRRLARTIAADRGWEPTSVSGWIILAAGRTNERRVAAFRSTLRAVYPDDGRRMRSWLRDPEGQISAMSVWRAEPGSVPGRPAARLAPRQRVRRTNGDIRAGEPRPVADARAETTPKRAATER